MTKTEKKLAIDALERELKQARRLSGQTECRAVLDQLSRRQVEILDKMIALHEEKNLITLAQREN